MIEGIRLVEEALRTDSTLTMIVYDADQLASTERGAALLEQIADRSGALPATAEVIAAATDTVTPQGVLAVARWPELRPTAHGAPTGVGRSAGPR